MVAGILLSTRGIVAIPLLVYFSYKFLKTHEWIKFIILGSAICTGFLLTLFPFIIWDFEQFMSYNPITLQANFLSPIMLIILIIISIIAGIYTKNFNQSCFVTSIVLFIAVFIPFISSIQSSNLKNIIFHNGFDISYFIFSLPFLIISMPKKSYTITNV